MDTRHTRLIIPVLRAARPDEADLLTRIAARSKAYWPYDAEYLNLCNQVTRISAEEIRDWPFVVAEINESVVGFYGLMVVDGEFMLDHLWIEPAMIGRKIGRLLFEDALIKARSMGWLKFLIAADPYAEAVYRKMGARKI